MRESSQQDRVLVLAGHRLRAMRLDKGESREQAARKMQIGEATLGRLERGLVSPRAVTAKRAAEYYGAKPSDIWRPEEMAA